MSNANHLLNALAAEDKDEANGAFESIIQDRLADYLEVAKVEIASSIMDDLQEGEGMDAQRRWVRQVAAIGKAGGMKPMHRADLKKAARQVMKKYSPHGAEFLEKGADFVKGARQSLRKEEIVNEGEKVPHDYEYEKKGKTYKGTIHAERSDDNAKAFGAIRVKHGVDGGAIKKIQVREETLEEGGPTRKHFQQVADLLKNIPDEAKRKELAQHHAGLFKSQNPRFDHKRFYAAAGVNEEALDEVLQGGSKSASAAPSNAQLNRNVMTNIRRAVQTLNLKGVNPQQAAAGHRDFGKLAAKNPKAPGYMLMRKLQASKASSLQSLTQAGVPLGGSLEANPNEFNQALQRIKRFK